MVQGQRGARFVAFALMCTAACTSAGGAATVHPKATATTINRFPAFTVQISGDAPAPTQDGVRRTIEAYLAGAVTAPLHTGTAGDVTGLFTADVAGNVAGADHASLVDDGIPGVVGLDNPQAALVVTAAGDDLAAGHLDMTVVALVGSVPVTIHRTGDITFVRDGDQWHIDGYDLHVTRDSAEAPIARGSAGGRP
jgi:hypothetical protein